MIYFLSPRVVSFTGGNPFPLTTRNLGASRVHSLYRRITGKLSLAVRRATSCKMRAATSPKVSIHIWGVSSCAIIQSTEGVPNGD